MPDSKLLRCGVIGTGYLGTLHASKYANLALADNPECELVAVYDVDTARAREVATKYHCELAGSVQELLARVDAVSIAVPTVAHADVAVAAASAGVHMLVEKPLAHERAAGERIAAAARAADVIVQVGHLERFNPVFEDLRRVVGKARFIECHRLSPYAGRGGDTDVVFDVMVHDLDLLSYLVGRAVVDVEAVGVPVLSERVDIANARLRFEGGCIANVTASRVSLKRERKLRIFQEDAYVSVDFDARTATIAEKKAPADGATASDNPMEAIAVRNSAFDDADPLGAQIAAFVASVLHGAPVRVGLEEGLQALALAELIVGAMEVHSGKGGS